MDTRWRPYVPVAQRRRNAAREMAKLAKKGHAASPVLIEGRTIATTFWGRAWCENLERYTDYSNRLPRGRTYVRNGSVVDLSIRPGTVAARVMGSRLYRVKIEIGRLAAARWKVVCKDCSGAIDSVVELLQGRLARGVMERLCDERTGLFPSPAEIRFECSCPDWASMCKHVAATLYGIGARLDDSPELFFTLRQVDQNDLIAQVPSSLALPASVASPDRVLDSDGLSDIFGLELATAPRGAAEVRKVKNAPARVRKPARPPAAGAAATRKSRSPASARVPTTRGRRAN